MRERELEAENEAHGDSPTDKRIGDEQGKDEEEVNAYREASASNLGAVGDSGVKQEKRQSQPNGNSETGSLDYGEDERGQNNQQPKNTASSGSTFTGRRIISYAD